MSQIAYSPGAFRLRHTASAKTPFQRVSWVAFVAVVHVLMIYGLLTTLGVVKLPKTPADLTIVNVAELSKDRNVPPPPPPVIEKPEIQPTIVPEITLDFVPEQPTAITPPVIAPVTPPITVRPVEPSVTGPSYIPAVSIAATHTRPDYPPISRRLGEHGTLRLKLTIAATGLVSDAVVVNSSGYERLDVAAVAWIKSHWRYTPAKQDGKPVASMTDAVVEFRLT